MVQIIGNRMAVVKWSRNNQQSTLLIKIFLIHGAVWNFCGKLICSINNMYIKGGLEVGIYYSVGQQWSTFAGVTNTLIWKQQKTILVQLFKIVWPCIVIDSLWMKPTDVLNSNFIGITTLHVSGSLSAHHQEFFAVHRHWYILWRCDDRLLPGEGWNCSSILLLVANGHHNCIKCTNADAPQRTPDDGQKGCLKHVES